MATPPPPLPPSASGTGTGGQPGSVEALASLLGIPLGGAGAAQPAHSSTGHALSQLLQLVQQQQDAQRAAAAPAPRPPPPEQAWQQPQQQQPQQQAWQPQAPTPHEVLLAALLQSAQQQQPQPQQPVPRAFPQPASQQGFAPLLLSELAQQAQAPPAAAPPPLPAFQAQEGHSRPSGRHRQEGATDGVAAGRKVRVSCNDVPGVLHIDSLYVACECRECEARVRLGHDRPIFGLSRWEKHCGSKAKKWRISLRVVPGSCPEVKANDPPMAVGTWLDLKGIQVTGSGERLGMDTEAPFAGIAAKRARLPTWGGESSYEQAGGMEQGGSPRGAAAAATAGASEAQEPLELAMLDGAAPGSSMSEAFLRQQQQVFAELRAGSSDGSAAQRQHAAIFGLAAVLLEGPAQHLLSEAYLPYINDLSGEHLARQTSTFGCYLDLLGQGMEWQAVHRQLMAFMRGTLRRILSRRPAASGPAAEGEDGAAAQGAKPTASSPTRPTTAHGAAAADQERGLPASGSTPGMAGGAVDAGEQAPVGSSSRGTGSVDKAGGQEQQPAAVDVKQEPEPAAEGQAAGAAASVAATAAEGVAAVEDLGAARPEAASAGQTAEAAGSSGPAAAGAKAEPQEPTAALPATSAGRQQQQEGAEQAAAAKQPGIEPAVQ